MSKWRDRKKKCLNIYVFLESEFLAQTRASKNNTIMFVLGFKNTFENMMDPSQLN